MADGDAAAGGAVAEVPGVTYDGSVIIIGCGCVKITDTTVASIDKIRYRRLIDVVYPPLPAGSFIGAIFESP